MPELTSDYKKVYMLLKAVIFSYHGLDEPEQQNLEQTSEELNAAEELQWALDFIGQDHITAFDRARYFLNEIIVVYPRETKIDLINMVWQANNLKGYVTEMEATAMLRLANDWSVQEELIDLVLK